MSICCYGWFGNKPIKLQILSTEEERIMGYQFADPPSDSLEGLLFVFDNEEPRRFHMNNVKFDLDLLGFDSNGCLICNFPMKSYAKKIYKTPPVKFVVEMPKGQIEKHTAKKITLRFRKL